MMPTLRAQILQLEDELIAANLTPRELTVGIPLAKKGQAAIKDVQPASVFSLHKEVSKLIIDWVMKDETDPDVKGATKIMTVEEILRDWQGVVYFDFTPPDARIRRFHPVDFFVDEACVGAFLNEPDREDEAMYFYQFEGDPTSLQLNMEGYAKMLLASKSFLYWQYAILEVIEQQETPMSSRFKEWMPKLFPGFNWNEYVAQYQSLRLGQR